MAVEPVVQVPEPVVEETAVARPSYGESPGYEIDSFEGPPETETAVEPSSEPADVFVPANSPGPFTGFILGDAPRIEMPEFEPPTPEITAEEPPAAEQPAEEYQTFDLGDFSGETQAVVEAEPSYEPVQEQADQSTYDLAAGFEPEQTEAAPFEIGDTFASFETPAEVAETPEIAPIYETPAEFAPADETPAEPAPFDFTDLSASFETPAEVAETTEISPIYETPTEFAPVVESPTEPAPFDFTDLSASFETPAEVAETPEIAPIYEAPIEFAPVDETRAEPAPYDFSDLSASLETPSEVAETPEIAPIYEAPVEFAPVVESPTEPAPFDLSDGPVTFDTTAGPAPIDLSDSPMSFETPVEEAPVEDFAGLDFSQPAEPATEPEQAVFDLGATEYPDEPVYGLSADEQQSPVDFGEFLPTESEDQALVAQEPQAGTREAQQSFESVDFSDLILPSYAPEESPEPVAEIGEEEAPAAFDLDSFAEVEPPVIPDVASTPYETSAFAGEPETISDVHEIGAPAFPYPESATSQSEEPAEVEPPPFDFGAFDVTETPAPVEEQEGTEPGALEQHAPLDLGEFDVGFNADAQEPTQQFETPGQIEFAPETEQANSISEEPVSFETFVPIEETPVEEFAGFTLDEGLARETPEIGGDAQALAEEPAPFDFSQDVAAEIPSAEPFDTAVQFTPEQPPFDLGEPAGAAEPFVIPEEPPAEWTPEVAEAAATKGDETIAPRTSTEFVLEEEPMEVAEFSLPELAPELTAVTAAVAGGAAAVAVSGPAAKVGLVVATVGKLAGKACLGCLALVGRAIGGIGRILKRGSKGTAGAVSRYKEARKIEPSAAPAPAAMVEDAPPISQFEHEMIDRLASLRQVHSWADQLLLLNAETEESLAALAQLPESHPGAIQKQIGALRSAIADDVRQVNDVKANPYSLYWTVWLKDERDVIATDLNNLMELMVSSAVLDSRRIELADLRNRYLTPDHAFYNHFGSLVLLYDLYPPKTVADLARRSGAMRCGRALGR